LRNCCVDQDLQLSIADAHLSTFLIPAIHSILGQLQRFTEAEPLLHSTTLSLFQFLGNLVAGSSRAQPMVWKHLLEGSLLVSIFDVTVPIKSRDAACMAVYNMLLDDKERIYALSLSEDWPRILQAVLQLAFSESPSDWALLLIHRLLVVLPAQQLLFVSSIYRKELLSILLELAESNDDRDWMPDASHLAQRFNEQAALATEQEWWASGSSHDIGSLFTTTKLLSALSVRSHQVVVFLLRPSHSSFD
jgi:hypothetical protein